MAVFEEVALPVLKLVDGSVLRAPIPELEGTLDLPDFVDEELTRYTDDAGKRMKPPAVAWLLQNAPKPYTTKRIYRGSGVSLGDFGKLDNLTLAEVSKKLFSNIGVRNLGQIRVGMPITVKRGKESSWSTSPQVATNFGSGMSAEALNFLAKTEIPAERVVVDFTEFPRDLRNAYAYPGQAEVVVSAGPVPAILDKLWISPDFAKWLDKNGFVFVPQKGIFPKL